MQPELNGCRLCAAPVNNFEHWRGRDYWQCSECRAVQMDFNQLPDLETETRVYLTHQNDVTDPRYQQFVSPITHAILKQCDVNNIGLDFGAGPGPVISEVLKKHHFHTRLYDPVFYPDKSVLMEQYDYIICCEVIEHFHRPALEFARLKSLLHNGGKIFVMTKLFDENIDFAQWHYKNDVTHVFFYHRNSLDFIQQQFQFKSIDVVGRLIVFST